MKSRVEANERAKERTQLAMIPRKISSITSSMPKTPNPARVSQPQNYGARPMFS